MLPSEISFNGYAAEHDNMGLSPSFYFSDPVLFLSFFFILF